MTEADRNKYNLADLEGMIGIRLSPGIPMTESDKRRQESYERYCRDKEKNQSWLKEYLSGGKNNEI